MAATVLNASGNLNYTNNTGGNVRLIIYYMAAFNVGGGIGGPLWRLNLTSSFGTFSMSDSNLFYAIGKDLAAASINSPGPLSIQNTNGNGGLPTQIMLANGESVTAECSGYNIAVIPENG